MELLIFLAILLIVFLAGYFTGGFITRRLLSVQQTQIERLEEFSKMWSNAATNQTFLQQQIAGQQSSTLSATLHAVIQALDAARRMDNTNSGTRAAIADLISQAKGIEMKNEFEE